MYEGERTLELFFRDNVEKLENIVTILEKSDYLFITSQRVWGSVGRLTGYYPMTQGFYRTLLGCEQSMDLLSCFRRATAEGSRGELGFELIKSFESYPSLGRWTIPDERADESFSVYDHPRVFLFRKTSDFSGAGTRAKLKQLIPSPGSVPPDP
jgi:hypothetical protein